VKLKGTLRGLDELGLEIGAVGVMAIIFLLVLSHAAHTGTADRLGNAPLVGPLVKGVGVAVDRIVTPS
jgi:hypothetical protein